MNSRRVARIRIEAPVTSFRYPHFLIGRQPTFEMPPPSTIYGHVASALGELPEPGSFEFGYHFEFVSKGADLEHQHIITAGGQAFEAEGKKWRASVQATVQPHLREFLFRPRLTLYLDPPELEAAFRAPRFCVILGRSQDLAAIVGVEEVELEEAEGAYLEHTLLPFSYRELVGFGVTVMMPRYIAPPPARQPYFERFIVLRERVYGGKVEGGEGLGARRLLAREGGRGRWWVDPSTAKAYGVQRGVVFHSCAPG
jgi:CRISPR-associated protein Cas5t